MMMKSIPQEIEESISEWLKLAEKSSKENTDVPTIEAIHNSFYKLMAVCEEEIEQLEISKDFERKIELLFFISTVLRKAAPLFTKNARISSLIKSNSLVYSRLANDTILVAADYNANLALKSRTEGKYVESIHYKNKVSDIQYKMKNNIFERLMDQVSTDFLNKYISLMNLPNKQLIERDGKMDDRQEKIIYPDLIKMKNVSRPSKKTGWYDWSVHLIVDDDILNRINNVKYVLYPTYLENEKVVDNRNDGFKLDATGWGEFEVTANIHFRDEETDTITKYHWLDLGLGGKGEIYENKKASN